MDLKTLMETRPEDLAKIQFDEYKKYVVGILRKITQNIERGNFEKIEDMTSYSPTGDGYGCENSFIDFALDEREESVDISEAVSKLHNLQIMMNLKDGGKENGSGKE